MPNVDRILRALGGYKAVAVELGLEPAAVAMWRIPKRNRIPAEYWPRIAKLAQARAVDTITIDALAKMRHKSKRPRRGNSNHSVG